MGKLNWTWQDWWEWYSALETDEQKTWAMAELNKDDWIKRLSPETQFKVFVHAPQEIKSVMKKLPNIFHHDTIILLQMELDKQNKKMRKYRR